MLTFVYESDRYRLRAWHEPAGPGRALGVTGISLLRRAFRDRRALMARAMYDLDPDLYGPDRSPIDAIALAIESGRLVLEREPLPRFTLVPVEVAVESEPPEAIEAEWIEIEVVDSQGNPVPHVMVDVQLPDGRSQRCASNENGWLRLEGIPGGNCKVGLPHWDRSSWQRG